MFSKVQIDLTTTLNEKRIMKRDINYNRNY